MQTKIQFQGQTLTRTKAKNNIKKVWDLCLAKEKYDWYQQAHDLAKTWSKQFEYSLPTVCGVIAALSPLKSWDTNLALAHEVLQGRQDGHTKLFINKALDILTCKDNQIEGILSGSKIVSFYRNILQPESDTFVTIDRHALSIAVGTKLTDKKIKMTVNQYEFFVNCYKLTANELNISPLLLQSSTWVKWRTL